MFGKSGLFRCSVVDFWLLQLEADHFLEPIDHFCFTGSLLCFPFTFQYWRSVHFNGCNNFHSSFQTVFQLVLRFYGPTIPIPDQEIQNRWHLFYSFRSILPLLLIAFFIIETCERRDHAITKWLACKVFSRRMICVFDWTEQVGSQPLLCSK